MSFSSATNLIEEVILKGKSLTYFDVHTFNLLTEEQCRWEVQGCWFGKLAKAGITRRTNKLYKEVCRVKHVSNAEQIENSLWRVDWPINDGVKADLIPKYVNKNYYNRTGLEDADTFSILGYVSAPDEDTARMAMLVTLGPRAHTSIIQVRRVGVGGWAAAKIQNDKIRERYINTIKLANELMILKKWEIENAECCVAFLESGATFDCIQRVSE